MSLFALDPSKVDKSLDSLFKSSSGPTKKAERRSARVQDQEENEHDERKVVESSEESNQSEESSEEESEKDAGGNFDQERTDKLPKKRKRDQDVDDVEDKYLRRILNEQEKQEEQDEEADSEREDGEDDTKVQQSHNGTLIHESLLPDTTELDKAECTVFVGNLSSSVITEKSKYKVLKNLFGKHGIIKSVRFRSIAFSEILPRKVAFINHKFHSSRDTVNAYIVYKERSSVKSSLELNGSIFLDHHLRVDSIAHPTKHDNKRCIFVGNLDFEITEEPIWKHFKECGEIEYVRLIRDSKTNIGKGFGYVQFKNALSVSKALLLDGKKMDRGRKLRITRAKNMTRPSSGNHKTTTSSSKKPRLTNDEKTKFGRAKSFLGKAGRAQIDGIVEGTRAKPGDVIPGLKTGSGAKRRGKPRIRARSVNFKKQSK